MKKKNLLCIILVLLCAAIIVSGGFFGGKDAYAKVASGYTSASSMLTLETSTNRVLYEKNADQKRAMASTTKIVTAITVLENCRDIDKIIRVPKEAVGIEGSSIYLAYKEQISIRTLLYGLMLQSGNDCAVALAHAVSGNVEKFAAKMNELAKKVGAHNSNFVNPHGLHHDNHYTTARELAVISSYAMKNETFKEIVGTKKYTAPWDGRDYDRIIINKNKILSTFDGGNGIKTGFTKKAGRCLVSSAERDGMQVICVVLNCGPMFEDCRSLMHSALKSFVMFDITTRNKELLQIKVEKGKQEFAKAGAIRTIQYPLAYDEQARVRMEFDAPDCITAPIQCGQEIGKIKIYIDNRLIFEEILFIIEEVKPLSIKDYLGELVDKWNE